jgi:DNA-binding HxlR family transcriptional regulator
MRNVKDRYQLVIRRCRVETVEYGLSPLGRSMEPILIALKTLGDANLSLYGKPKGIDPREPAAEGADFDVALEKA